MKKGATIDNDPNSPSSIPPIREDLFVVDGTRVLLVTAECLSCRELNFPTADTCSYCGGDAARRLVGPRGVVTLCTLVHRAPPGYGGPVPYGFGVVRIDGTNLEVVSRISVSSLDRTRPGAPGHLRIETLPNADGTPRTTWTFEVAA